MYSFAVSSLAPVICLLCFFEAAASSDGDARVSARSTGTNPAATRGFTTGEGTGVEVALGCSDSPVQPPPFWEHQGETVGEGETAERVLTLSSIVVFDNTLGDGWQKELRPTGLRSGWTGMWRCLIRGGEQHFGCGNSIGIKIFLIFQSLPLHCWEGTLKWALESFCAVSLGNNEVGLCKG